MKVCGIIVAAGFISGFGLLIDNAQAGPLDREPMEQRYNPAAENMLRIPGVVGMFEQDARDMLQQAGLAVDVRYIKEGNKYAGKEGTVVKQVPSVGGVAMLGSSVTLTVYMPPGFTPGEGGDGEENYGEQEGYPDGGHGEWDENTGDETVPDWGGAPTGEWTPPQNPLTAPSGGVPAPGPAPDAVPGFPVRIPGGAPVTGTEDRDKEYLEPAPAEDVIRDRASSLPTGHELQEAAGKGITLKPDAGRTDGDGDTSTFQAMPVKPVVTLQGGSGKTGIQTPVPAATEPKAVGPGTTKVPAPEQLQRAIDAGTWASEGSAITFGKDAPVPATPVPLYGD